jgi:hypothetical protein
MYSVSEVPSGAWHVLRGPEPDLTESISKHTKTQYCAALVNQSLATDLLNVK